MDMSRHLTVSGRGSVVEMTYDIFGPAAACHVLWILSRLHVSLMALVWAAWRADRQDSVRRVWTKVFVQRNAPLMLRQSSSSASVNRMKEEWWVAAAMKEWSGRGWTRAKEELWSSVGTMTGSGRNFCIGKDVWLSGRRREICRVPLLMREEVGSLKMSKMEEMAG